MARGPRRPYAGAGALLLACFGGGLALFTALPILALLTHVSWSEVWSVWSQSGAAGAVETSVLSSSCSTAIVAVFGVPLAYVLARQRFPGKALLTGLVYLPLVLPPVVGGILLLLVWGQTGSVEQFLQPHGLFFVGELSGIVLAQIFVSAPFLVVAARSAFERIDEDLFDAGLSMGAGALQLFWMVAVPLSLRSILAGAALSWMRSFGEFGATVIMAYHPYSFPVYTWVQFNTVGFQTLLPLALLGLVLGALALVLSAGIERLGLIRLVDADRDARPRKT